MEDIVVNRPRYQRRNVPAKRRGKRNAGTSNTYMERLLKQVLACIVILIVIGIINSVNTPVTKYLSGKIKAVMLQDINLKSAYKSMDGFFKKAAGNNKAGTADKTGLQGDTEVAAAQGDDGKAVKVTLTAPIEGVVSSPFGMREDPFSKNGQMHTGVDIDANSGDKIKAAADGEVVLCSKSKAYGNYIRIKHADGIETLYAHCSKILTQKGRKIKQNEVIGEVGSTGTSTGSHLHFEVIKDGKAVDPLGYINLTPE